MAGCDDPLHLIDLFDHHHRLMAEAPGQDRCFDVTAVFVAIADQQGVWVAGEREGDQQFGFAARFQTKVPTLASFHEMLHHMSLLVALDRKHALVAAAIVVMSNGAIKGGMQPLETIFQDVVEANQKWRLQIPGFQPLEQLHQVEAATAVSAGLNHHIPLGIDREIGISPAIQPIELSAASHRP